MNLSARTIGTTSRWSVTSFLSALLTVMWSWGFCIVGRPVSFRRDDGLTLEVTRLCTDGHKNACSFLYGAAWKAARAMGYKRIGTYTTPEEGGASLPAAGWKLIAETPGKSWSTQSRPRVDKHPIGQKSLWQTEQNGGKS